MKKLQEILKLLHFSFTGLDQLELMHKFFHSKMFIGTIFWLFNNSNIGEGLKYTKYDFVAQLIVTDFRNIGNFRENLVTV